MVTALLSFSMMLTVTVDGTTPVSAKALAAVRLAEYEAEEFGRQWECLEQLWHHESGWDYTAANPSSSARGIPQALVALHGLEPSWVTNPDAQVRWGLRYIYGRYGNACAAWEAWKSRATLRQNGTWHGGWY